MTKVTVYDTYLNTNIVFYVNKNFTTTTEAQKILRLKDYLYFSIVSIKKANLLEKIFIPLICEKTSLMEDVLASHVKYLIIK